MKGDGRVFLRSGSQVYHCAYYLRGKEYRESTGEIDPDKALKFLRHRLKEVHVDEMNAGTFVTPQSRRLTIRELVDALKDDLELRGKLSAQNASHLRRAIADFGDYLAIALTPEKIDKYKKDRLAAGDRPASVNRPLQLIGQAYRLAIRRGHLAKAPYIQLLSEKGNARQGFFSEQEFRRVVEHLPSDLKDFAEFGYITGMRSGEMKLLTWDMMQGDDLHIPADICKNRRARTVPLAGKLAQVIERRRALRKVKMDGMVQITDSIFYRVIHGQVRRVGEYRKAWNAACVAAGMGMMVCPDCKSEGTARTCEQCKSQTTYHGRTPHDFRRSAARNMTQAGVPREVAKLVTGHVSDSMWERYNIVITEDARAALQKRDQYCEAQAQSKVVSMGAAR